MRITDYGPFMRSTIGFDRMFELLDTLSRNGQDDNFPPYDIERIGDDRYRLTVAVAGYGPNELSVLAEPNALLLEGRKSDDDAQRKFLHRGIARRAFRRQFELADFVRAVGASYENGLLSIELDRELPEAMKPRRIEIATGQLEDHRSTVRQLENA